LCGVGRGTTIDHLQISYVGDDAIECFGGTVNVKHIVCYRNWDDDFDTDFGYRGFVQFGLSVRDPQIADQSGSNGFESDNDAQGNAYNPYTQPHYSNMTVVGPYTFDTNINSNFKRGAHLRRNTQTSIFNSIITGYPVGLLVEASTTQDNATTGLLRFQHNVLGNMADTLATVTTANPNNVNGTFNISSWFGTSGWNNETVNSTSDFQFTNSSLSAPDFTLNVSSPYNTGADFTNDYLAASFFEPVTYRGAFGSTNWTSGWANWDPINEPYLTGIIDGVSEAIAQPTMSVYPNPANDQVNVVLTSNTTSKVRFNVVDLSGKIVLTEQHTINGQQQVSLNTASLSNGFYLLQVSTEQGTSAQRFSVQH
jgi:hypothetical protein